MGADISRIKAGAQGYLSELLRSIRAVHAGKKGLSPAVSFQIAQHASDGLTASNIPARDRGDAG
jgi:hypothetical protein